MSKAAELNLRWLGAFEARDVDGMLALSHPDIQMEMGERTYRGHAGIREFMDGQTWGVAGHVRPERVFARDGLDATVVVLHFEMRHVSSSEVASVRPRSVGSARLRDGLIVHVSAREPSLEAAIKAHGLTLADELGLESVDGS